MSPTWRRCSARSTSSSASSLSSRIAMRVSYESALMLMDFFTKSGRLPRIARRRGHAQQIERIEPPAADLRPQHRAFDVGRTRVGAGEDQRHELVGPDLRARGEADARIEGGHAVFVDRFER